MKCGLCGEEWAVCIPNTVQGGQINLCKSHYEYVQAAEAAALSILLERYEVK
jgi:ribosome-binding protein aMBF1 (putative translation factor)